MKYLAYLLILTFIAQSCSIQKRHYTKGFYIENTSSKSNCAERPLILRQKSYSEVMGSMAKNSPMLDFHVKENAPVGFISRSKKSSNHVRNYFHSVFPKRKNPVHDTLKHEIPDPSLNQVAKAGFRMSMYSLAFLSGALYLFFQLDVLFYIILGVFIVAFIFALVSLLTSVAAGKDRVATDRKGLRFSRSGIIISLLIFAAIASFFIFAPLIV